MSYLQANNLHLLLGSLCVVRISHSTYGTGEGGRKAQGAPFLLPGEGWFGPVSALAAAEAHCFGPMIACSMSMGRGKMMVEFFSAAMVVSVCRYRSWRAAGDSVMTMEASFRALDAFISPSAAMTYGAAARRD